MLITWAELRATGSNIRIHGNGFVQVDLPDGRRVHLFGHPDVPRQRTPTPIHDHRFSFESEIMCGTLINVCWEPYSTSGFRHTHFECGYVPSQLGAEDTRLIPTERTYYMDPVDCRVLTPGDRYSVRRGEVHETFANEPTLTLMRKLPHVEPFNNEVRVFCRIGHDPDNSFNRYDASPDDLWRMVSETYDWAFGTW